MKRRHPRRKQSGVGLYRQHKENARSLVYARLAHWTAIHPFAYGQVRIKNTRGSWGSCSSKKNLNFNWRLVGLTPELADYIVLHELCHTVHLNHSRAFWELLTSLIPHAYSLRAQLRSIPIVTLQGAREVSQAPLD